jgi:hypothetical protein
MLCAQVKRMLGRDTGLERVMKSAGFAVLLLLAITSRTSATSYECALDDLFAQVDFVGVVG